MTETSPIIENPITGERARFHLTGAQTDGRLARAEFWTTPGGGVRDEHVHPHGEERFEVLSGRMWLRAGGVEHVFGPGDRAAVPAGTWHTWRNVGDEELHFFAEMEPAARFDELIGAAFALDRAAHDAGRERAGLLQQAVTWRGLQEEIDVRPLPRWAQRLLFAVLASLGRALGHRAPPAG
jgi:quercetin dioxygenase-like cupin family protein